MIKFETILGTLRRGETIIGKIYSKNADGEYRESNHVAHTAYNRSYVKARINDLLQLRAGSGDIISTNVDIDDDKYWVLIRTKKGSKKYDVLKAIGFFEIKPA